MTLESLIAKAKATTKKYWKWMLGVTIALIVAFVWWRLQKQRNELDRLKAELAKERELAKDLEVRAKTAENARVAEALREQARQILADVAVRAAGLAQREKDYEAAKKRVQAAKTWDQLPKGVP